MNPELQKAIADVLTVVKDGAQFAAATAKAELPLLVQEYLRWGVFDHARIALGWLVLLIAGYKAMRFVLADKAIFDEIGKGLALSVISVPMVFSFLFMWDALATVVKILIAPRVYLLETLSKLVQ